MDPGLLPACPPHVHLYTFSVQASRSKTKKELCPGAKLRIIFGDLGPRFTFSGRQTWAAATACLLKPKSKWLEAELAPSRNVHGSALMGRKA